MPVRRAAAPAAKPAAAPKPAKPATPTKPRAAKPVGKASKPKQKTKRQKSDDFVARILAIGEGRTGIKAKRSAKVRQRAQLFASGLANFHKRNKPKSQEDVRRNLAEAYGDRGKVKRYAAFYSGIGRTLSKQTPLSGKRSLIKPGQIERAKGRLSTLHARLGSKGLYGGSDLVRTSATRQTIQRASAWYSGQRPTTRPGPVKKPVIMPSRVTVQKEPTPAKRKNKKANPVKKAKKRFAKQRTAIQEKSDYGAKRRVFQRKVIGVQASLIGRSKPVFSGPRQIGTLSKYRGEFTPSASSRRRSRK